MAQNLPRHKRQHELTSAFPQRGITVVLRAKTAETAELTADHFAERLRDNPSLFPSVGQPDSGEYFERNGLIYESLPQVEKMVSGLISARGLSELDLIGGCGMLIAFLCSLTIVPAVLTTLNPPGEVAPTGFNPVDLQSPTSPSVQV
ncbi:hypothetical protein JJB98_27675 [Bradyrhizobium diazoefficiens]|nr:hypothetical protein [Bradyrhizobium diazoefficiens]QQO23450.1 hypothetical protein JJB98_27675 [Bradyrhizobium diazoefficiens]